MQMATMRDVPDRAGRDGPGISGRLGEVRDIGGGGGRNRHGNNSSTKQRGLRWNGDGDITLIESYAFVSFDSVTGANQKAADFYERIERRFLDDSRCPSQEEFEKLPMGGERTQWYGRGALAVKGRIGLLKKEIVALYAYRRRLNDMELTGNNASDENLYRASIYLCNGNCAERDAIYDVLNDPDVDVGPKYKYEAAYKHCVALPRLRRILQAGPVSNYKASRNEALD
jgi:hypothetical protein